MTQNDLQFLRRTVELAAQGRGRTSPNPLVGAVVVKDGEIVGEGYHDHYGGDHAEVKALKACSGDPAGATIYISLEPCCHQGKTPPCTDAIIAAGISRVVVASDDPTEKACGRGLGILRDEGIGVDIAEGEVAAEARLVNQPFRKHARTGMPYVTFKSAATLDGRVATDTGESKWISSEASRELVHRWRAEADAICIGIGTALDDDPLLTARGETVALKQPVRIIFDSEVRLDLDSQLIKSVEKAPVIVVASRAAKRVDIERLEEAGVQVTVVSGQNEAARVKSALQLLGSEGIQNLLLEGGPHLVGAFFDADQIDQLCLFFAPVLIGSAKARGIIEGEGLPTLEEGRRPLFTEYQQVGSDLLIKSRMHEW